MQSIEMIIALTLINSFQNVESACLNHKMQLAPNVFTSNIKMVDNTVLTRNSFMEHISRVCSILGVTAMGSVTYAAIPSIDDYYQGSGIVRKGGPNSMSNEGSNNVKNRKVVSLNSFL